MKKIYQIPALHEVRLNLTSQLLLASDTPGVNIGDGKRDDFDVKAASTPDYNVWDDDWSK